MAVAVRACDLAFAGTCGTGDHNAFGTCLHAPMDPDIVQISMQPGEFRVDDGLMSDAGVGGTTSPIQGSRLGHG
jgi:hypothetical protein